MSYIFTNAEGAKLTVRPGLFWLAAFLSSFLLFPPNKSIVGEFTLNHAATSWAFLGILAGCALGSLALVIVSARKPQWDGFGRRTLVAASIAYLISYIALLIVLSNPGCENFALVFALGFAQGATVGFPLIEWVRLFEMDVRSVMANGALAMIVSIAVSWFVSWLPARFGMAAMAILATISIVAFLIITHDEPTANADPAPLQSSAPLKPFAAMRELLSVVWVPFAGALLGAWMMSSYTLTIGDYVVHSEFIGGAIAAVITMLLCIPQYKTPYSILIDRIALPILIGASIVFGAFAPGSMPFYLGASSVYGPIMFLSLYATASLVAVAKTGEFPLPFIFGIALLGISAAEILGTLTARAIANTESVGQTQWVMVCTLFAAIIIHSGYTAWRQSMTVDDSAEPRDSQDGQQTAEAVRLARIAEVVERYGLTKRESEVLDYLSRGYGSKFIGKTLFISDNTARTHVHNIYRKLDIRSREELLSLFNQ